MDEAAGPVAGPVALRTALDGLRRLGVGLQAGPPAARLPVVPGLCTAPGHLALGAVATVVDCAAGVCCVLEAGLGMHATTDLAVELTGRPATGPAVLAVPRLLRRRRAAAVIGVDVHDGPAGDGALLAVATVGFAEIPGGGAAPELLPADTPWPPPDPLSLDELVAPIVADDGRLVLALDGPTRNLVGVLGGGVAIALAVRAAEAGPNASAGSGGPTGSGPATAAVVHFLNPGRVGPVAARADAVRAGPAGGTARVVLSDTGAGDRPVLAAVVTLGGVTGTASLPSDWSDT